MNWGGEEKVRAGVLFHSGMGTFLGGYAFWIQNGLQTFFW
jgi:hypothetical protein